ncbi:MAG: hypothetical protein K2G90_00765 [Muribaculaceae bacterium]|nr:hypothetical protein [Muribaculaceae bacterium]
MKETRKEIIADLVNKLSVDLELLQGLLDEAKDKWVIASEGHVFVGYGKGINGTGFAVRGVAYSSYPEYPSFSEAQRNIDPYLIDGKGNPIYNKPVKATEFYLAEIKTLRSCLTTLQELV